MELNASDERGIAVIREKVKRFSQNAASEQLKSTVDGKNIPGFKLVILDEADSMTSAAQVKYLLIKCLVLKTSVILQRVLNSQQILLRSVKLGF